MSILERPLRIAQIAPLYESVPPQAYGGTERVISALTEELVRRGHQVTLFAAGRSRTSARLEACSSDALRLGMSRYELERVAPHLHLKMLADIYARADEFDVIHAHTDIWTLPFAAPVATPTVVTMHGRLDLPELRKILPLYPDLPLVSISNHQRVAVRDLDLNWAATCYNGLDLSSYLAQPRGEGRYLAFLGRLTPEKRPDWAVEAARRCGMPLRVAAKIDPLDMDYWEAEIEPLFAANDVEFIGEIDDTAKPAFLADAAALLFPIDWPEPFGLVMIEAMAAGCPVVALRRGSVPEVVTHGVSGFICDEFDDMVRAVDRLAALDADRCRSGVAPFTAEAMTDRYVELYEKLLAGIGPGFVEDLFAAP